MSDNHVDNLKSQLSSLLEAHKQELRDSINLFEMKTCSCDEEESDDEEDECDCEETEDLDESVEVFLDEETGEQYFIELNEETLLERRIKIRVTARGRRIKRIKCPPGRVLKNVNGRQTCVTPTGRQRLVKKLASRKMNRTKKAKGRAYQKRTNFRRQRAITKRRAQGLRNGQ